MTIKCKSCGKDFEYYLCEQCPEFPEDCDGHDIRGNGMCMECCIALGDD